MINFNNTGLAIIVLTLFFLGCDRQQSEEKKEVPTVFSMEAYSVENGFGYMIKKDGRKYIDQPHIPGIQGVKGFSSLEKAKKAGQLVIKKLENNMVPPTLTKEELEAVGAL